MPQARPYLVSLASRAITSSSSLKRSTLKTGTEELGVDDGELLLRALDDGRLVEPAGVEMRRFLAAVQDGRAFLLGLVDLGLDPLELTDGRERPHLGLLFQRIADLDLLRRLADEIVEEAVGDTVLHVEARARDAALAAGAEDAGDDAVGGAFEIRVLEHHDRRLAAELKRHLGEVLGRVAHDVAGRLRAAGEADAGDQGMGGQHPSARLAEGR